MRTKFYILYKTTNIKNNKFYIGVHETFNLEDGYLGSGKRFKNSLYYHGKENFKREILEYFDNTESMYNRESEIINEELLKNPKCLNLVLGGKGGWQCKGDNFKHANEYWQLPKNNKRLRKFLSERNIIYWNKLPNDKKNERLKKFNFKDNYHSEETKKKMRESAKGKHEGTKNSQFGTCWITDEIINKKIYKGDGIPNGFRLGRILKQK